MPSAKPELSWYNIIVTVGVLFAAAGAGWTLFQTQFSSMERQFQSSDKNLLERIVDLKEMAERNRDETIHIREHNELVKRVDTEIATINDRLKILETTRPTTGELQGIAAASGRDITDLKDRIRSLEDNLRKVAPLGK